MCNSNTSSQAKEAPVPLPDLPYLFQQICLDYVILEARQYLVIADRYSGWASTQQAKKGNGSKLINSLRTHCETFRRGTTVHLGGAADLPGDLGHRSQAEQCIQTPRKHACRARSQVHEEDDPSQLGPWQGSTKLLYPLSKIMETFPLN